MLDGNASASYKGRRRKGPAAKRSETDPVAQARPCLRFISPVVAEPAQSANHEREQPRGLAQRNSDLGAILAEG